MLFQKIQQHTVMNVTTVNFTEIPRAMTLSRTFALRASQILGTTSPMKSKHGVCEWNPIRA